MSEKLSFFVEIFSVGPST